MKKKKNHDIYDGLTMSCSHYYANFYKPVYLE